MIGRANLKHYITLCTIFTCKYLTIYTPKERVKWFITVILNNRTVLILKARHEGHSSIQQRFRFSTVNYCRRAKQEHINILPVTQENYEEDIICG